MIDEQTKTYDKMLQKEAGKLKKVDTTRDVLLLELLCQPPIDVLHLHLVVLAHSMGERNEGPRKQCTEGAGVMPRRV